MSEQVPPSAQPSRWSWIPPGVALTGFLVIIGGAVFGFRRQLSLEFLAAREAELRSAVDAHPAAALAIAFAVYVVVAGLSLPGATAMSVACGWLFGFWRALILVSFASTGGATIAFL